MRTTKAIEKTSTVKGRSRAAKPLFKFNPQHTALPDEEVQWLVMRITTRRGVKPFVRRLVVLIDELKAGRCSKLPRAARRSKDPEFDELMSALSDAVREGRKMAAYHTAFYAASCAYQNSLDYLCELMSYLDKFRDKTAVPE
jgi:hypothetical protein